jgi:hypothetical protein
MSVRAIAFVEEWISENINAEAYEPEGDESKATAYAVQCASAAKNAGIPDAEMKDAFESLTAFIGAAMMTATDNEVERLASKDDLF